MLVSLAFFPVLLVCYPSPITHSEFQSDAEDYARGPVQARLPLLQGLGACISLASRNLSTGHLECLRIPKTDSASAPELNLQTSRKAEGAGLASREGNMGDDISWQTADIRIRGRAHSGMGSRLWETSDPPVIV